MKTITCRILTITISIILLIQLIGCQKSAVDTSGIDRFNHGIAYLEQGEYKNAITELEAALRADPTNFEALKNLAGAYAFDGDWTTARDKYIEAREMRPNDPSNYVNLATVFMNLQEFSLAWDNIEIARNTDPSYPLLHYAAGELFRIQDYEDDAVAAFTEYISLEPNTRPAGDAREIIELLRPGQYEDEEDTEDETAEVEDEEIDEPEPEIIEEEPEDNDDDEIDEEMEEVTDDEVE
jgi:tetratricopeptide (TPR) repeat protein